MSKILPEIISTIPRIAADIATRTGNDLDRNVLAMTGASSGRAMFMGRQCMAFECMREAINVCGIEADFCSIEDEITEQTWDYDVFVMFLMKFEPGLPALIQQRMNELRALMPRIPTMALLEDTQADATTLHRLGFSTIIMGLPSLNFAVTAVRLLSLRARTVAASDCAACEGDRKCRDSGSVNDVGTMLADISFTKRELDLIDLLRSGMQNKLIAHQLGISESTVKAHLRNIMTKLHAKNRTQTIFMLSKELLRRQEAVPA